MVRPRQPASWMPGVDGVSLAGVIRGTGLNAAVWALDAGVALWATHDRPAARPTALAPYRKST